MISDFMSSSVLVTLRVNGGVQLRSIAVRFTEIIAKLEGAAYQHCHDFMTIKNDIIMIS